MIQMISSGNILKDYEDFLKVLMEKYNIQDRESFEKDFFDFLSKVVKPEYKNLEETARLIAENPDEIPKISKEFFTLIEKHSAGFDFYEGASTELKEIKQKLQDK